MKLLSLVLCALIFTVLIGQQVYAETTKKNKIEGSITYRERIALPQNAKACLILYEDNNAGIHVVTEEYFSITGRSVPFSFYFEYPEASIKKTNKYLLKAIIFTPDNHVFAASELTPVDLSATDSITILTHIGNKKMDAGETDVCQITPPAYYRGSTSLNTISTKITLQLDRNHEFLLIRENTQDKKAQVEVGRWYQIANGHILVLGGSERDALRLLVRPGNILILTDRQEYGSTNVELLPLPDNNPLQVSRLFTGIFTYYKNGSTFKDCLSGTVYSVSQDGAYKALKQAYLARASKKEQPFRVHIQGHIVHCTHKDTMLMVVDHFYGPASDTTYPNSGDIEELTNKYWKLIEINGKKAISFEDQTEPHIILRSENKEYFLSGSDGCNRLIGMMDITEKGIQFKNIGSTMMLCPKGTEQSAEFTQALSAVDGWRVFSDVLELLHNESPILVFECVAMD